MLSKLHIPAIMAILAILFLQLFSSSSTQIPKPVLNDVAYFNFNDSAPIIPVNTKGYKGTTITKNMNEIHFTSATDNDYYRTDTTNRHCFLYVETRVDEFFNDHAKRVPLNLSIVIDRSGSMEGDKIKYAREAAIYIIEQLKPEDRVNIIAYDDKVTLIQASTAVTDKQLLKKKIAAIYPGGSTNLWGGTEKGYEQIKNNFMPGAINRVLLLSDGLANEGLTDEKAITYKVQQYKDKEGITFSSFGLGLDYNENLMTAMAESGTGNYYFIESAANLAGIFSKELNGLMNIAAQNTALKIEVPQGVTVEKVYHVPSTNNGNTLQFNLRDLFSQESKGILLYCRIDNQVNQALTFTSTLSYQATRQKQLETLVNKNIIYPMPSLEKYEFAFNEKVIQQAILNQANENMEKAIAEADMGHYENAQTISDKNNSYLQKNNHYVSGSAELKKLKDEIVSYNAKLVTADTMSVDDIKRMQKSTKEANYKIRTKKH